MAAYSFPFTIHVKNFQFYEERKSLEQKTG